MICIKHTNPAVDGKLPTERRVLKLLQPKWTTSINVTIHLVLNNIIHGVEDSK